MHLSLLLLKLTQLALCGATILFPLSVVSPNHQRLRTYVVAHPINQNRVNFVVDQQPYSINGNQLPHIELKIKNDDAENSWEDNLEDFSDQLRCCSDGFSKSPDANKYSILLEKSPWRPILNILPKYSYSKNTNDDNYVELFYDRIRDAARYKDSRNYILPIGIKPLHNPQRRLPEALRYSLEHDHEYI